MGQKGEYHYQKTVKSIRELHQFRVENNCSFVDSVHFLNEYFMPCTGGKGGRKCAFKLMALAPDLANGTIRVYAHSRHNHPIQSNEKTSTNELVPDDKSAKIVCTEDNFDAREETLKEQLSKANEKVYKWMAAIGANEIEGTIGDWDKMSLLKLVEMADLEIRENPERINFWFPWMKCAIPKCLPQIEGFNARYKELIKMTFQ